MILFSLLLFLSTAPAQAADSMAFDCQNYHPPSQQGEERFLKLDFRGGKASLELAGMAGPSIRVDELLVADGANYSDDSTSANAGWANSQGNVVQVSLVYLGSFWGGNLRFNQAFSAKGLEFAMGEETDLRCVERKIAD